MIDEENNDTPEWKSVSITDRLRFVERNGHPVLQQEWQIITPNSVSMEWRDVPMEAE